jgi:glycosyltransferase involved in cell wall biosynthesis
MEQTHTVLVVGSSDTDQGGIGSVFQLYKNQGFFHNKRYLISHQKGPLWLRLRLFSVFMAKYIHQLIFNPHIKIVHAHLSQRGSFYRKALVFLLAKLCRKKVIYHLHGSEFLLFFQRSPKPAKRLIQVIFNGCDAIIVLSESWKRELSNIIQNPNIHVVYNPVVIADTPKQYEKNNQDTPHFLFLGRLGRRKGVYDILDAVQKIKKPNFIISLYGDGEVDVIRKLVQCRGLEQVVQVRGWIHGQQKAQAFQNAHVLLLPSHNEGLPMSILEALAQGMPVLSSTVGGIPEAIAHGTNGLLVEPGDSDMLADYLQQLASSPHRLREMSQAAYDTALQKFNHTQIFEQLEQLYQSLLTPSHPTT